MIDVKPIGELFWDDGSPSDAPWSTRRPCSFCSTRPPSCRTMSIRDSRSSSSGSGVIRFCGYRQSLLKRTHWQVRISQLMQFIRDMQERRTREQDGNSFVHLRFSRLLWIVSPVQVGNKTGQSYRQARQAWDERSVVFMARAVARFLPDSKAVSREGPGSLGEPGERGAVAEGRTELGNWNNYSGMVAFPRRSRY